MRKDKPNLRIHFREQKPQVRDMSSNLVDVYATPAVVPIKTWGRQSGRRTEGGSGGGGGSSETAAGSLRDRWRRGVSELLEDGRRPLAAD